MEVEELRVLLFSLEENKKEKQREIVKIGVDTYREAAEADRRLFQLGIEVDELMTRLG